jgi:hypothetical protein
MLRSIGANGNGLTVFLVVFGFHCFKGINHPLFDDKVYFYRNGSAMSWGRSEKNKGVSEKKSPQNRKKLKRYQKVSNGSLT